MAESVNKVFLHGQNGKPVYGVKQYVVDSASDISELPIGAHVGSSCLVISTGEIYMLNGERKWTKVPCAGGSGGSGGEGAEALTEQEILDLIDEASEEEEEEDENDGE